MIGLDWTGMWILNRISRFTISILLSVISFYRKYVSSLLGKGKCRFYPTCSAYAEEALKTYGLFYGGLLSVWRILRCAPWSDGGYDPVPEQSKVGLGIWFGNLCRYTADVSLIKRLLSYFSSKG